MSETEITETPQVLLREYAILCKRFCKKQQQTMAKQDLEYTEAQKGTWFAQVADSILANPQCSKKGESEVLLTNVHTQELITVPFNAKLSALDNAQLFYKKAKKAHRSLEIIHQNILGSQNKINQTQKCINLIEELILNPDSISQEKVNFLRSELVCLDILKAPPSVALQKSKKNDVPIPYRHITLDGWDVYIGKNDSQNDELSTRFAKPSDIWFHVASHAGSHIIIRRPKNAPMPPKNILETVASFAIWFSKIKHTSFADVHYTEARYVHKLRRSPPGQVVLDQYKSLRVAPKNPQDFFKDDVNSDFN